MDDANKSTGNKNRLRFKIIKFDLILGCNGVHLFTLERNIINLWAVTKDCGVGTDKDVSLSESYDGSKYSKCVLNLVQTTGN